MSKWHVNNTWGTPGNLSTTFKTQLSLLAKTATLCPGRILEMSLGPLSAPTGTEDNIVWEVWKQDDDAGTATDTFTTEITFKGPGDPTGVTCRTQVKANYSTEPGMLSPAKRLFTRTLTMRGTLDWIAADLEAPLPWSAVNSKGLAIRAKCASNTPTVSCDADFEDL